MLSRETIKKAKLGNYNTATKETAKSKDARNFAARFKRETRQFLTQLLKKQFSNDLLKTEPSSFRNSERKQRIMTKGKKAVESGKKCKK